MTLIWQRRRFVCDDCGARHLEEHPEFEGNLTRRLARQIVADARVMTISAATRREGLGRRQDHGCGGRLVEPDSPRTPPPRPASQPRPPLSPEIRTQLSEGLPDEHGSEGLPDEHGRQTTPAPKKQH